jgi:hypothetical protein
MIVNWKPAGQQCSLFIFQFWLGRASDAIASYWRERNARKAATTQRKPSIIKGSSGMAA